MPSPKKTMVDVRARIGQLEDRRGTLLASVATSAAMATMYGRLMASKRPARASSVDREALEVKYRELHSARLADAMIARAHARCLTVEIGALRAISGESLQGTGR